MDPFDEITSTLLLAAAETDDEGGAFLVEPGLGLMIWTMIAFLFTVWVLSKFAFPYIKDALRERANKVSHELEAAERQRAEAEELLAEYRHRLKEAREQAEDIVARAKRAGETARAEAAEEGRAKREELVAAARKDIEVETKRSLERIRREIADLTVVATEKMTRMSLGDADHQRLVEEALGEIDFSALAGNGAGEGAEGEGR